MLNENIIQKNMESEYDNSGRVENSSQLLADFISDAADYRHEVASSIDFGQSYGSKERNKLDLFWPNTNKAGDKPDKSAPIVMFIHGGYWQRLDRSAFSHMAKGLNANGIAVAIPSYTLCPDITISGIIDEIRRACIVLWKTYDCTITVCGHSAGGHLAACMLATNWNKIHQSLPDDLVPAALSISGVFELAPLIDTSHNEALKITQEEARTASPYNWIIDHGLRFDAWVGGSESSEFIRQSRSQAQRWRMMGANARYQEIAGANHFTAVAPLTDPNSFMVKRLLEMLKPVKEQTLEDLKIPVHNPMPINENAEPASNDEIEDRETQQSISETAEKSLEIESKDTDESIEAVEDTEKTSEPITEPVDEASEQSKEAPSPEAADTHPVENIGVTDATSAPVEDPDDLTKINGIGNTLQARIRGLGFSTFEQLAELSESDKNMIEDTLDFKGRIDRDNWITQARHLHALNETAPSEIEEPEPTKTSNPAPGFTKHTNYQIELEFDQSALLTLDGNTIAETSDAIAMLEGKYPPVLYIPRADISAELTKSETTTYCPFKGTASYWNIITNGETTVDAAWSYEEPFDEMQAIKGFLAFYPEKVDIRQI